MPRPVNSCTPVNTNALKGETAPLAIGRSLVLVTCGSRFRSHRSLMVQPAPRMTRAPLKNRREVPIAENGDTIGVVRGAASRVEKRHGKKR